VGASLATFAGQGIKGAMLRFIQRGRGGGITGFGYQNGYECLPLVSVHTEQSDGADSDPITLLDLLPSGGPDPHAAAEASMVREAVQGLPERERTVMMLFYWPSWTNLRLPGVWVFRSPACPVSCAGHVSGCGRCWGIEGPPGSLDRVWGE
jgi:hypothetical protein